MNCRHIRRALSSAVGLVLLALPLATVNAGATWGDGSHACVVTNAESQFNVNPSLAVVGASTAILCPRVTAPPPGADRAVPGTPHGPQPQHQTYEPPPADSRPCDPQYVDEAAAVVWIGNQASIQWYTPDGKLDGHNDGDLATAAGPPSGLIPLDFATSVAGTNHLSVRLVNRQATYGGANGWSCKGGAWVPADSCTYQGVQVGGCARLRFIGPQQSVAGGPLDPTPFLLNQKELMKQKIAAGVVGTSPSDTTRQFTFVPSCFWMTGTNPGTSWELQLHDPTADGRSIIYVYRVTVGLQNVHWDYGDGSSYDGDVGHPWTSGTPDCTNAHTYERVSRLGNPGAVACPAGYPHPTADDGCYAVTATQTYAVHVAAYWFDGSQPRGPVDMGAFAPITVTPPQPTYVRVLQIEGVPITR